MKLASRLKHLRQARQWSLSQLSEKTAVSRATLSRLENAEVSPTTEVLGKLCSAYGLTMSRLLSMIEEEFTAVIPRKKQAVWAGENGGFKRRSVSPPAASLAAEVLECTLDADISLRYETPSVPGLEHHLYMQEGYLEVVIEDQHHALTAGDCLRYQLYGTTEFHTVKNIPAKYILVLI